MPKAFMIEVQSDAAGIVVQDGRNYRFFAATVAFNDLEGRDFRSPAAAQRAAQQQVAGPDHRRASAA